MSHGGKRVGAGRKKSAPTKQMRLNEHEQLLVQHFRTMTGDTKQNLKALVKYMGVLELDKENDK